MMKTTKWVCSNCKDDDVEMQAWIDANTNEVTSIGISDDEDDCWCNKCEEHYALELVEVPEVVNELIILYKKIKENKIIFNDIDKIREYPEYFTVLGPTIYGGNYQYNITPTDELHKLVKDKNEMDR